MDTTTGFGHTILRTLSRLELPLLAALALLVFALLATAPTGEPPVTPRGDTTEFSGPRKSSRTSS